MPSFPELWLCKLPIYTYGYVLTRLCQPRKFQGATKYYFYMYMCILYSGYIAAFSETLALACIVSKAIAPLKEALVMEPEDHVKAATAWTLGQIGRHTPDHARALAEGDVLRHLLACMVHENSSEDLKTKAKRALKAILAKCTHLQVGFVPKPTDIDHIMHSTTCSLYLFFLLLSPFFSSPSLFKIGPAAFAPRFSRESTEVCAPTVRPVASSWCGGPPHLCAERGAPILAGIKWDGRGQVDRVHYTNQQLLSTRGHWVL